MGDNIPSSKHINAEKHKKNSRYHKNYKTNSKTGTSDQPGQTKSTKPTVSKLPSNWEKYERQVEDESVVFDIDFDALLQLPRNISQFQLKQDKVFLPSNESSLNAGHVFELDMNLISLGLSTIPFYKRIGIPEALISENELQCMNKAASDANELYLLYLSKKPKLHSNEEKVSPYDAFIRSDEFEIGSDVLDKVEEALPNKDDETTKLEEWLDNVL